MLDQATSVTYDRLEVELRFDDVTGGWRLYPPYYHECVWMDNHKVKNHSWAAFCGDCGEIWLKIVLSRAVGWPHGNWLVEQRKCPRHGEGTILKWDDWSVARRLRVPGEILLHDFLEMSKGAKYVKVTT